jgi:hypothetical protein
MMEYAVGAKLIPYKESLEDVIVRLRRFQTEDNQGETVQPAKVPRKCIFTNSSVLIALF